MNWLDRAIAAVAPASALRRVAAREALSLFSGRVQNRYDAARPDRSVGDWWTTGSDANAEIGPQLRRIRSRARDLGRNNPYVSRAYDVLTAKIVGAGMRPRLAQGVPDQIRQRTLDAWRQFADEADADGLADLYGLQALAVRIMIESGESLVRFVPAPEEGLRIPLRLRILEPEWVDMDKHQPLEDGGRIIYGVEFGGGATRPRAYWLHSQHPGADLFTTRPSMTDSVRVPAALVAPMFRRTRSDQVHGVPWAAPIVMQSRHLDDVNDALLKRAKVQACFAAFVERIDDVEMPLGDPASDPLGRRREQIAPGIIEYLRPGEKISFGSPPSSQQDHEWMRMMLHSISAGLGCTYAQMTGDLRDANYSSMRAGYIDQWSVLDQWQQLVVEPMHCRPIWRQFDGYAATQQRRSRLLDVQWDFPERPMVDPVKDGQAQDEALRSGRRTFSEVIAGRGRDPAQHKDELRREQVELDGLVPHVMPVRPSATDEPAELMEYTA